MRLPDKVAIVTGAARGIGRGIALGLAREGARVAVVDILDDQAKATAAELRALGPEAVPIHCDVSVAAEVDAMVEHVVERWGRIDILVNNAGICPFHDFLTMPEELWDHVQNVNLKGVFLCSQRVARVMVAQGIRGSIISTGSISSIVAGEYQSHYCSTKAGIDLFMKSIAIALGPYGIRCNVIQPGAVETDINRADFARDGKGTSFAGRTPLRRLGQPEDLAGPVIFLASDESGFMTGGNLVVDGGLWFNLQ